MPLLGAFDDPKEKNAWASLFNESNDWNAYFERIVPTPTSRSDVENLFARVRPTALATKGAELLHFNYRTSDYNAPQPGDIVRLRHDRKITVLVWHGNFTVKDVEPGGWNASFFYYPYVRPAQQTNATKSASPRNSQYYIERNSFPPRITKSMTECSGIRETLRSFFGKADPMCGKFKDDRWLTTPYDSNAKSGKSNPNL